jgi:hypothetical protein
MAQSLNKAVLKSSIDVLKILYMVVAGLALADGLERFVFSRTGQFEIEWRSLSFVFFIIFITTVVRFVHGAMRHFDYYYIEQPEQINWEIRQPLWDFVGLGTEAFLFFLLAFSVSDSLRFITYYLALLSVDSIWIVGVFLPHIKRAWAGTPRNWLIANLIVLIPTGILWLLYHNTNNYPLWVLYVFFIVVLAHTCMDYWKNWEFYFGRPWSRQPKVEILFIAGAYMSNDPNEIKQNIQVAEQYSIELWNRGYKVFCPHLNTCNFEVKAKAEEEAYKEFDMRMLQFCDAVFALPNWQSSTGAKAEIEEAKRLGKPIFYSLDELPAKKKGKA